MRWKVNSEYGVLTDVLVCRPDHFRWAPINYVSTQSIRKLEAVSPHFGHDMTRALVAFRSEARKEHDEMVRALEEFGVRVHYLDPQPQLQMQVYTRDSSSTTPWGPVLTQLDKPERRGEYAPVLTWHGKHGDGMWRLCSHGSLEGGDIHIIRPGLLLVGWSGERSHESAARQYASWYDQQGWETRIEHIPGLFLHLDVLFCMVAEGLALACTDVLPADTLDWLSAQGIRLLPVSYKETLRLGNNVLACGKDRVISAAHSTRINEMLAAEGLTVLTPNVRIFTDDGGSVRCMTMPLRREPV